MLNHKKVYIENSVSTVWTKPSSLRRNCQICIQYWLVHAVGNIRHGVITTKVESLPYKYDEQSPSGRRKRVGDARLLLPMYEVVSFPDPPYGTHPPLQEKGLEDRPDTERISDSYGIQLKFRNARAQPFPFIHTQKRFG